MDYHKQHLSMDQTSLNPRTVSGTSVLSMFGISPHKNNLKNSQQQTQPVSRLCVHAQPSPQPQATFPTAVISEQIITATSPLISSKQSPSAVASTDQDEDIIEYTPTKNGRRLRERKIVLSTKAVDNVAINGKRTYRERRNSGAELMDSHLLNVHTTSIPATSKRDIRNDIAMMTAARRNRFLLDTKHTWLPLLPGNNYIQKLVEKYKDLSAEEVARSQPVHPYVEFAKQPRGVQAVMKPYQLSGLSFMVYLQGNGLGGILADEMGLGKTLQTLSLVQHLKESEPNPGKGRLQRPCLVICPLSVLSSWKAEADRWTPGLRVIRFHGPVKERIRLKKIVMGEIDMFGQLISQGKAKHMARGIPALNDAIPLYADKEDDISLGVDLVVTTYESFRAEQAWFKRAFIWRYAILDEGHMVKNPASLISKSLQGLSAEYRLILTGTPLQNNLSELWALLHWLYPEVFENRTKELFDTSFDLSKGHFSSTVLDSSRRLLELIMLRRMKNSPGVDLNLPPKREVIMYVPLSPMQQFWYKRMITKADSGLLDELFEGVRVKEKQALLQQSVESERAPGRGVLNNQTQTEGSATRASGVDEDAWLASREILLQTVLREKTTEGDAKKRSQWQSLMNLVMRLRQVSNHPYQITNAEPDPYFVGEHVITASGKFIVLEKLLQELVLKQKKKILIFSGFTEMLNLVEELLLLRGGDGSKFRFARIDGSTCRARRNLSIRMVNDLTSDFRVMLISTRAGGLGINLASASDIVLLDQDWNPQITLQAESRAHRIGQKNPVTIYKFISQGTVEEQMMGRIQKKLYLSAKVTESMSDIHTQFGATSRKSKKNEVKTDDMPEMSVNQLLTLIRRGASAISRPAVDLHEMQAWDWETTVARCKDQPIDITVRMHADPDANIDEEAERMWLTEMEKVEASVLDGKSLHKDRRSNRDIAHEFFASDVGDKADRRIGKNVTVEIDGFAVSKNTLECAPWEAVKTLAGTDPRLAEPKRENKAAPEPQPHCQICFDGGELHCCQRCPRSYHLHCLDEEFRGKTKAMQFVCPQHECYDCAQKTGEAGGMLFRCRWCERAYCEDCLDFGKTTLIGNDLPEYEILGFPEMTQAFYVQCPYCTAHFEEVPGDKTYCDELMEEWRVEHERRFSGVDRGLSSHLAASSDMEMSMSSRAGSMTDATTIETPGVMTPAFVGDEDGDDDVVDYATAGPKRKTKLALNLDAKRSKLRC